jgi:hypothetical protein
MIAAVTTRLTKLTLIAALAAAFFTPAAAQAATVTATIPFTAFVDNFSGSC